MRHIKLFSFLIFFFSGWFISAQEPANRPACKNSEFDNKVASTIRFTVPLVSCEELFSWTCEEKELILLDAREPAEFLISHIPGASHVGYTEFKIESLNNTAKNARIVVYCSIGYRSEKIGEQLQKAGFRNVYNLYGSIFEWGNLGYPLVDENEKTTHSIHTYNSRWSKWVINPELNKIY